MLPVLVVSLDIAIDAMRGNVLSHRMKGRLIDWAITGRMVGLIAGPPCETWTAARFFELVGVRDPPKPIRSADVPSGLPDVTNKELQ